MVNVVVRVTHPSCFMAPFFLAQVQNLQEVSEVAAINVSLAPGLEWTPSDMSGTYRRASRSVPPG